MGSKTILFLLIIVPALAAIIAKGEDTMQPFLIASDKPFVYIRFDHVGKREPSTAGEYPVGLWLRLVNNCRIPIVVNAFDLGTDAIGVGLNYSVERTGDIIPQHGSTKRLPTGYTSDTGTPFIIKPGGDLLFSVPLNAVGPDWHVRTTFEFELPPIKQGIQPHSVVGFFWEDLPEDVRAAGRIGAPFREQKK